MLLLCPPKLRIWPTPSCPMNRDEISLMRPFRTCQRRKQCVSFCEPPPSPPPAGAEAGSPRTDTNRLRWQSICKGGEGGPTYNTNPSQDVIKTWGELGPTNLHINKLYGRECGHSCDDQTPPSLKRSTVTSLLKSRLHTRRPFWLMRLVFDKSTEVEMMLLKFIFATFHACALFSYSVTEHAWLVIFLITWRGFKKKKGNNS